MKEHEKTEETDPGWGGGSMRLKEMKDRRQNAEDVCVCGVHELMSRLDCRLRVIDNQENE